MQMPRTIVAHWQPSHSRRSSFLQLHRLGGVRVTGYHATIPCDIHGDFEIFKLKSAYRTNSAAWRHALNHLRAILRPAQTYYEVHLNHRKNRRPWAGWKCQQCMNNDKRDFGRRTIHRLSCPQWKNNKWQGSDGQD